MKSGTSFAGRACKTVAAVASILMTQGAFAGVNLVTNGSFENPVVTGQYIIGGTPTGWTGTVDLVAQGYAGSVNSGAGLQWIDLNPSFDAGTGLSQMINLVAGQSYSFSFMFNGGGGGSTTAVRYTVGSDLNGSVSTANMNVYGGTAWQTLSTTFVSSSTGATLLKFTPNGSWSGGFIDNVELSAVAVQAVPEPTTWAMMLTGFGAIGFGMRRGQRKVASLA